MHRAYSFINQLTQVRPRSRVSPNIRPPTEIPHLPVESPGAFKRMVMSNEKAAGGLGRRQFINTAALASLAGVAACTDKATSAAPVATAGGAPAAGHADGGVHLKPGELDTYYGLWSG